MSENENVEITQNEQENFEIKEEVNESVNIIDPLEKLVSLEFNEEDEVNIDEYAEVINIMERDASMLKNEEAEVIIKNSSEKFLKEDYLEKLEKSYASILNFYKKYDPNSDLIKDMKEDEKNKIYSVGNFLNKNYSELIDNMDFTITLLKSEYVFLSTAIERKITYDGNEVFNIIDLNERYLKSWKENFKKITKDVDTFDIDIDIKNIVMLYHFLQKHTVKGLSSEFYNFASVLQKIAETNKVYNAFNIKKDRANTNFLAWTSAISPEKNITPTDNTIPGQED